jgi:hypothetical protein
LLETYRCGQAARAASDDHHVVFHRLAGSELRQNFLVGHVSSRFIIGLKRSANAARGRLLTGILFFETGAYLVSVRFQFVGM